LPKYGTLLLERQEFHPALADKIAFPKQNSMMMIGRMIAPAAPMMLPVPAKAQISTLLRDR